MSGVERADGSRHWGPFPRSWGRPPGDQFSEERARWVREKVAEHRQTAPLPNLTERNHRFLWMLRIAELERKRETP